MPIPNGLDRIKDGVSIEELLSNEEKEDIIKRLEMEKGTARI
jgi:hypothetical protein